MRRENGFTMVELMIALAISGVVMAAVYTAYRAQQESYVAQEQAVTMQQNLRAGMYFLQKGLRMAGFDPSDDLGAAITVAGSNSIAFTRQFTEPFRDNEDNSGDQSGTEAFVDSNGNNIWDSDAVFTIRYFLDDSNADGVNDALASNFGGPNLWIAENIMALGFAYAFDKNPLDGELDTAGGNTIWAIDINGDGVLDLNIDTNGDGIIDAADDTDGDGTIDGAALGGPTVTVEDIRAVRIWLLARAQREDRSFYNGTTYVVSNQVITPNDSVRRKLMTVDLRFRNLGL